MKFSFLSTGIHPSARLPLTMRMLLLGSRWLYRNDSLMSHRSQKPSFYFPADPQDVSGIETNPSGRGVDEFVPMGFESYVWLPNPAWKWVDPEHEKAMSFATHDKQQDLWAIPVNWSAVAAANGKHMYKNVTWAEICGPSTNRGHKAISPNQVWTWSPAEGNIEPFAVKCLATILASWTSPDTRCLSGRWEGVNNQDWDTDVRLVFSNWTYNVWSCRFDDLIEWLVQPNSFERGNHLPHVIWPEDRCWFLAVLYSGCWSYVGGPRTLINSIIASDLEAYEVEITDHAQ